METIEAPPQPAQELWDYEVERGKPVPGKLHSRVQALLITKMVQQEGPYDTFSELELELEGRRLTPDLCIYPQVQIDYTDDEPRLTKPPLLAIEIISPTQPSQVLIDKIEFMLAAGVKSCWLVQPPFRIVTVLRPGALPRTFTEGQIDDDVLDFRLSLEDLFPQPRAAQAPAGEA